MMTPHTRIVLYLGLTFLFSAVFYALIVGTGHVGGGHGAYATGLMWCPGLAALLACRITGLPLSTIGWSWGASRWQWYAYFIPLGYTAVAYAVVYGIGAATFPDPEFVAWARKSLH